MKNKKIIYVCSKLRGDIEKNLKNGQAFCKYVALNNAIPIASHIYFTTFLDDNVENERILGMQMGIDILPICDEVWSFGEVSCGMKQEIELAKKLSIPVKYIDDDIIEKLINSH